MLTGAFFAIWGADVTAAGSSGSPSAISPGGDGAPPRLLLDHVTSRPDRRRHGDQLPRPRAHRLPVHPHLRRRGERRRRDSRRSPTRRSASSTTSRRIGGGFLGDVFGEHGLMIWVALALVFVTWVVVFKTPVGLRIRSVGEHPRAADTVGINVYRDPLRRGHAVGDARRRRRRVPLARLRRTPSSENMTAGRGFIALAALIFGNWRPFGAAVACLLFGFSSALAVEPAGVLTCRSRRSSRRCRTSSRSSPSRASSDARSHRLPLADRTSSSSVRGRGAGGRPGGRVAAGIASVATPSGRRLPDTLQRQLRPPARRVRDPRRGGARGRRARPRAPARAAVERARGSAETGADRPAWAGVLGIVGALHGARAHSSRSRVYGLLEYVGSAATDDRRVSLSTLPRSCSTSAPASARPAPARGSTSRSSKSARRSARSTCARSRTSSSTSCPRRRTCAASCARTPRRSASTASRSSTSTTRASRSARTTVPIRARRAPPPAAETGRRASRGSPCSRCSASRS